MPGGADRWGIVAAPQTPSGGADPAPRDRAEGSWGSWNRPSELKAALPGAFGKGLDTAVVLVAAAVEDGVLDAGGLRAVGEDLAGLGGLLHRLERAQVGLGPVDGGQRAARVVVDELGEDAAVGAEHADARALGGAVHLRADAAAALEAPHRGVRDGHARLPTFRATYSPW